MAIISFNGTPEIAFDRLRRYIETRNPLQKFGDAQVQWDQALCRINLKGQGYEAEITAFADHQTTRVRFDFKPSFLLKPFASQVESQVMLRIEEALSIAE